MTNNTLLKTIIFTVLVLIAFAANSVLCRLALGSNAIDASSFTAIRLLSGTIVLLVILSATRNSAETATKGSWTASFLLFIYALAFSYAYVSLDTGTGALILAGSVQMAMILLSLIAGARLHLVEWTGLAIWYTALGGLSSTLAAVLQLSVPAVAILGGAIFVSEAVTLRLVASATCITHKSLRGVINSVIKLPAASPSPSNTKPHFGIACNNHTRRQPIITFLDIGKRMYHK